MLVLQAHWFVTGILLVSPTCTIWLFWVQLYHQRMLTALVQLGSFLTAAADNTIAAEVPSKVKHWYGFAREAQSFCRPLWFSAILGRVSHVVRLIRTCLYLSAWHNRAYMLCHFSRDKSRGPQAYICCLIQGPNSQPA